MRVWEALVAQARILPPDCVTLAGFNGNIDATIHVNQQVVDAIVAAAGPAIPPEPTSPDRVDSLGELAALLRDSVARGKSQYSVVEDAPAAALGRLFASCERRAGGQGVIISNQMAELGADSRAVISPLSALQAELVDPRVRVPAIQEGRLAWLPARKAATSTETKVNWIFEYSRGVSLSFPRETVVAPRANRVILGTRSSTSRMCFPLPLEPLLSELGAQVDVAFLTGYHRGRVPGLADTAGQFVALSLRQLQLFKAGSRAPMVHYEYVPMRESSEEGAILGPLAPQFDSLGLNEHELPLLLERLGIREEAASLRASEGAWALYQGALLLQRQFGIPRVHVHNLGYYVVVLRRPYWVPPEAARQACLAASVACAIRAQAGRAASSTDMHDASVPPLSTIGYQQLAAFSASAQGLAGKGEGIWQGPDHYVLVVPAHVVAHPAITVGMGDTVSSVSLVLESSQVVEPRRW